MTSSSTLKQIFSVLSIGVTASLACFASTGENTLYVQAGAVFLGPGMELKSEQTIIVSGGEILEIVDGYIDGEVGDETIGLRNSFLMPGFIDTHVHVTLDGSETPLIDFMTARKYRAAFNSIANVELLLMSGFTTVQDVGDFGDGLSFEIRDAIKSGKIMGPRLLAAGPMIGPTGTQMDFWGSFRDEFQETFDNTKYGICDGADDCRRLIRETVKRGADVIKIKNTGGVSCAFPNPADPGFTMDELTAIVSTAHQLNRKVMAHAICIDGINEALAAGVDSITHGTMMNQESIRLFQKHDTYLVPTLLGPKSVSEKYSGIDSPYDELFEEMNNTAMRMLNTARKSGVKIAFGSDSGFVKHAEISREFLLMSDAGMPSVDILKSATIGAARMLGIEKVTGSIAIGKSADIVATSENPLLDIGAATNVGFVMKQGRVYKNELSQ